MSLTKKEIRGLIYECKAHQLLNEHWELLTEQQRRDVKQFERELVPLFENLKLTLEANLTEPQVQELFKKAEQVAAGGDNRTLIGKGADVVEKGVKLPLQAYKAINDKLDQLFKEKIKTMQPVKDFDAAFTKLKAQIIEKTGGKDALVAQSIDRYQKMAKEHPIAQSLILGAVTALATFAVANPISLGIGGGTALGSAVVGAVINFGVRSIDRLLKGQEISDVIFQGVKSAALGALIGLGVRGLVKFAENIHSSLNPPIPLSHGVSLGDGTVNFKIDDPKVIEAIKKLGVNADLAGGNDILDMHYLTGDTATAEQLNKSITSATNLLSKSVASGNPQAIAEAVKECEAVNVACEAASKAWSKAFEANNSYVLDPSKNQWLQTLGIKKVISQEEYYKLVEGSSGKNINWHDVQYKVLKDNGLAETGIYSNFDSLPDGFVPTKEFAVKCADVYKAAKSITDDVATSTEMNVLGGDGFAVSSLVTEISTDRNLQVGAVVGQMMNLAKIGNLFNGIGQAAQAVAQSSTTAVGTAQDNQAGNEQQPQQAPAQPAPAQGESIEHTYELMLQEGLWDTIKQKTGQAVGAVKNVAHNVANKVTADKLNQAWVKAGKPLDMNAIMNVIKQGGLSDEQLHQLQGGDQAAPQQQPPVLDNNLKTLVDNIKKQNLVDAVKSYLGVAAT